MGFLFLLLILNLSTTGAVFAARQESRLARGPAASGEEDKLRPLRALRSHSAQDGDVAPTPSPQETQVRGFLDSDDPEDWVRGLTVLNIELASALRPGDGGAPRPVPRWIAPLLREYLLERALEIPDRTRRLLRDEILRTPDPGEWVLLELLLAENQGFRPQIEAAITRIAADPVRRERLVDSILTHEAESPPDLFPRVFPLLAPHEPGAIVGRAIAFYREHPREDVRAAIERFLGRRFSDGGALISWWDENRYSAIHEQIVDRARGRANARTVKLWALANKIIAEGPPAQQRTWLLQSLDPKESPGPVRRRALQEIENFVARITTGEDAVDQQTQGDLLGLLLRRLQQIISGEITEDESDDPAEVHATRVNAVRALRSMAIFREDPQVLELLGSLISGLRSEHFDTSTRRGELGLIAVEVAGALRAPLGPLLDDTLEDLIGSPESAADWQRVPTAPFGAVLRAISSIGVRPKTVELLGRIVPHRPEWSEDVVNALLRPVPVEARAGALEVLAELVRGEGGTADGENLRKSAIIAIGRLGEAEGIEILIEALVRNGIDAGLAGIALQSLEEIGGGAALDAVVDLLSQPEVAAVIERPLLAVGTRLATADPTLEGLDRFLIDDAGEPRRWFLSVLGRDAIAPLLDPALQLADFRTERPDAFERFAGLHGRYWQARVGAVLARPDLMTVQEGLARVLEELPAAVEYLGPVSGNEEAEEGGAPATADPLDPVRVVLASILATAESRAAIAAALGAEDTPAVLTALESSLAREEASGTLDAAEGGPFRGTAREWLLGILEREAPISDPTALLDDLEGLSERYPMGDEVRARLLRLRPTPSTPEETDSTPPTPEPGSGD